MPFRDRSFCLPFTFDFWNKVASLSLRKGLSCRDSAINLPQVFMSALWETPLQLLLDVRRTKEGY
jgi:hypothetical protein